jgi:hypothetical protein
MANFFTRNTEKTGDEVDEKSVKVKKSEFDASNDLNEKPARKPRGFAEAELKAGRWVAPIILLITMAISGILWLVKNFNHVSVK